VMTDRATTATIRDVALRAGVSTATVSRVLAGIGHSRPDTAAAVRAAAGALDYRPSGVARSLRMKRTRTLGLIITDIQNPFFPELVQAADLAARGWGYSILLGSAAYDEQRAMHYLDLMVDRRVDGMIIASSQLSGASWRWLPTSPVPVVVVNAEPPDLQVTVITSDNFGGGRLAAEHLIGLGHRRIAYIRGSETFTADVPRMEGFRAACRDAGLRAEDTPELRGDGQFEGGERAAMELLGRRSDMTAIACYNDTTAIGAMRALRAASLRVPADVSVVGCDDIAAALWVAPALTTVAQQKAEMGRQAVERLAAALADPDHVATPETVRLPMVLRERESTATPVRP
ncbi:MAG: LacI family transcriptional regulator, partial [Chloroflexota bacterium]|nr:LacI family transcriptional regulator [Chloroflexota bacterium]